jgi:hypothetical protein
MSNIDPLAVAAWILILAGCLGLVRREMGEIPMSKAPMKALWALRYTICIVLGGAIYFGHQFFEKTSFVEGWPDAIACTWKEPMSRGEMAVSPTKFIFQLKSTEAPRSGANGVTIYTFPGGCMRPQTLCDAVGVGCSVIDVERSKHGAGSGLPATGPGLSYYPHEVWFTPDGALLRPTNRSYSAFDSHGQSYKFCFLDEMKCGGENITDIKNSGNAFSFARGMK